MKRLLLKLLTILSLLLCIVLIAAWVDAAMTIKRFRDQFGGSVIIHDAYATMTIGWREYSLPDFALPAAIAATAALPMWQAIRFTARRLARQRRRRVGLCTSCGYDLTGNVSGVCPECGRAVVVHEVPERVFVALVEVRPRAKLVLDPAIHAGAAVRCYVPAETEAVALARLREVLHRDGLEMVELEFCHPYDGEWTHEDDGADAAGVGAAVRSGAVAYGTFHTWGHDAPDA